MEQKRLILIRHAERKTTEQGEIDALSQKGKRQALRILDHFIQKIPDPLPQQPTLVSSPKNRCIETLQPLSDALGVQMEIQPDLDEGGQLDLKVERFVAWWRHEAPVLTVVCSHADWLPICLDLLTGMQITMKKGAWAEIETGSGRPTLVSLIQEFR